MSVSPQVNDVFKRRMPRRITDRTARAIDIAVGVAGLTRNTMFVSGFWRSGTTWLQELISRALVAKTVFEPLSPHNDIRVQRLVAMGFSEHNLREAFIPGRADKDDPMWDYLDRYFRGTLSSRASIQARETVWESFRRDVVLKDVRLQANLGLVHERYGVPIVHVRRHPCAVVHSLTRAKWKWNFGAVRLADIMAPLIDDLNQTGDCHALIVPEFDADATSRIAAYWAATERIADHLISGQPWARTIPYGRIVESKEDVVVEVCALLGRTPKGRYEADFDSATTITSSMGKDSTQRAVSWRTALSAKDISRIIDIASTVFPKSAEGIRARVTSSAREAYGYAAEQPIRAGG